MAGGWVWDPSLYAGSARYYATGRLPYPPEVADVIRAELALDGTQRLLDLGCGPGSLTLVLAPLFREVVGLDADAGMIDEATEEGARTGHRNIRWVCMRAEALPSDLGRFGTVTMAQSFHWMDGPRVAPTILDMLTEGGAVMHVGATTHRGMADPGDLPGPVPPRDDIDALISAYLGSVPRAGQGTLPNGGRSDEDEIFAAAGFVGPRRLEIGGDRVFSRTEDEVVASVFSLSKAAPHLFGGGLMAFEQELRNLLRSVSPSGQFWERARPVGLSIWTRP